MAEMCAEREAVIRRQGRKGCSELERREGVLSGQDSTQLSLQLVEEKV